MQQHKIQVITLFLSVFLFIAFSDGPAGGIGNNGVRKQDRTGSPHAIATGATCAACHNDGSFSPSLAIELLDNGTAVNTYEPGKTYQLRYALSASSGTPSAYGIQSVVLEDGGNDNAGTFGSAPAGTRIAPIQTRSYFEHTTPSTASTFEVDWIAPDAGTGQVTVYASGVAANLDNDNDNDGAATNTLNLDELISSLRLESLDVHTSLFPNPGSEVINLQFTSVEQQNTTLHIINALGVEVHRDKLKLNQGATAYQVDITQFPSGVYWLFLNDKAGKSLTKKFVVK